MNHEKNIFLTMQEATVQAVGALTLAVVMGGELLFPGHTVEAAVKPTPIQACDPNYVVKNGDVLDGPQGIIVRQGWQSLDKSRSDVADPNKIYAGEHLYGVCPPLPNPYRASYPKSGHNSLLDYMPFLGAAGVLGGAAWGASKLKQIVSSKRSKK